MFQLNDDFSFWQHHFVVVCGHMRSHEEFPVRLEKNEIGKTNIHGHYQCVKS